MTKTLNMTGSIFIEGTMDQADYDFDMEWEGEGQPTPVDALNYLVASGILQILHEDTQPIDDSPSISLTEEES